MQKEEDKDLELCIFIVFVSLRILSWPWRGYAEWEQEKPGIPQWCWEVTCVRYQLAVQNSVYLQNGCVGNMHIQNKFNPDLIVITI